MYPLSVQSRGMQKFTPLSNTKVDKSIVEVKMIHFENLVFHRAAHIKSVRTLVGQPYSVDGRISRVIWTGQKSM